MLVWYWLYYVSFLDLRIVTISSSKLFLFSLCSLAFSLCSSAREFASFCISRISMHICKIPLGTWLEFLFLLSKEVIKFFNKRWQLCRFSIIFTFWASNLALCWRVFKWNVSLDELFFWIIGVSLKKIFMNQL